MFIISNKGNSVVNTEYVLQFICKHCKVRAHMTNDGIITLGEYPNELAARIARDELIDALRYNEVMIYRMPSIEDIWDIIAMNNAAAKIENEVDKNGGSK